MALLIALSKPSYCYNIRVASITIAAKFIVIKIIRCGEDLKEKIKSDKYRIISIESEYKDSKGERKAAVSTTITYHKDDQTAVDKLASAIASSTNHAIEGSKNN